MTNRIQQISQWPLWARVGVVAGLVFVGLATKILEDLAIAFRDWAGEFLSKQHSHFGSELLAIGVGGWVLGILTAFAFQRSGLFSVSALPAPQPASAEQEGSTTVNQTPQKQVAANLDNLLEEMALGGAQFLPQHLGRLRLIFDRLDRDGDAAWCIAEENGYDREATPDYRYADATISWRSGGVVHSAALARRPPDKRERVPINEPAGILVRNSQSWWERPTGASTQDVLGQEVREVIVVSPEASQGVLRRIRQEAYQRAIAAREAIEVS